MIGVRVLDLLGTGGGGTDRRDSTRAGKAAGGDEAGEYAAGGDVGGE